MIAGGLAYLYPLKNRDNIKAPLYYIGIISIIISCFVFQQIQSGFGYYTLLPVAGAYLIILSGCRDNKLTSNKLSFYIGKWSYSIYLWHWPIVVYLYINQLSSYYIYGIAASIALGALSHLLIEKEISFPLIN